MCSQHLKCLSNIRWFECRCIFSCHSSHLYLSLLLQHLSAAYAAQLRGTVVKKRANLSGRSLTWTGGIRSKLFVVSTILSAYVRPAVQSTASAFGSPLITTLCTTCSQYRTPYMRLIPAPDHLPSWSSSRIPASNSSNLTPGRGALADVRSLCSFTSNERMLMLT